MRTAATAMVACFVLITASLGAQDQQQSDPKQGKPRNSISGVVVPKTEVLGMEGVVGWPRSFSPPSSMSGHVYLRNLSALRPYEKIVVGDEHTLVLKEGSVFMAGWNGPNGRGNQTDFTGFRKISSLQGIVDIAAGAIHSVALDAEGRVFTWGGNSSGQLGYETERCAAIIEPRPVEAIDERIQAVAAADSTSYALDDKGQVWTFGSNAFGELANGTRGTVEVDEETRKRQAEPRLIEGLGFVKAIAAGGNNAYIITRMHSSQPYKLYSWGRNDLGQLGLGLGAIDKEIDNEKVAWRPIRVPLVDDPVAVAAGKGHAVALCKQGALTWGLNTLEQLGRQLEADVYYFDATPRPIDEIHEGEITGVSAHGYVTEVTILTAGETFARMSEAIRSAQDGKTFRVDFTSKPNPGDPNALHLRGTVLLSGGSANVTFDGAQSGFPFRMGFIGNKSTVVSLQSDPGQPLVAMQRVELGRPVARDIEALLAKAGMMMVIMFAEIKPDSPGTADALIASDFKYVRAETLDGRKTWVVSHTSGLEGEKRPFMVTVWVDAQTCLPVKKSMGDPKDPTGFRIEETYTWDLNPKLDGTEFLLPEVVAPKAEESEK